MAKHKNIMPRYFCLIAVMAVVGISIIVKGGIIMFGERDYWQVVAKRFVTNNVSVPAVRGNILSADGQLMASSLPEYKIYMDFLAGCWKNDSQNNKIVDPKLVKEKNERITAHLDDISKGLHKLLPDRSAREFKAVIKKGMQKKSQYHQLYPDRISYTKYQEVKQLLQSYLGRQCGLVGLSFNQRKKPFGSLARRTLGEMFPSKDSAISGLELSFDSLLRGTPGLAHKQRVMNHDQLLIVDRQPEEGCDIISTIDVDMQDIAEKALRDKLKEINALWGTAVLMEVATGDVKAIVNLTRTGDSLYAEKDNWAVGAMMEPGSTFKTASIMVAMDDGYITPDYEVDTGNGVVPMHGGIMRDHNWHRGGYGKINVSRILEVSSNVGVSSIIDHFYHDNPQKYVDGLKRMSIDQPLHLQVPGEGKPKILGPKEKYFAGTTLPWMSIGYEVQLPPIATLTFYNAIANGGKMVKPRFVRAVRRNGEIVREFPTEVIREQICSPKTLKDIQDILELVVSKGLGKKAGCKNFKVSGKTGTAQVAQGGSYRTGRMKYLISFCGYYPSDQPKYSCIVAIQKSGLPASGGGHCGPVFSEIAQSVMAKGVYRDVAEAADSNSVFVPDVLDGDVAAARSVLQELDIPFRQDWNGEDDGKPVWGTAANNGNMVALEEDKTLNEIVPDVRGMGAKDAVYLLECRGLKVRIEGVGHVVSQSLPPHSRYKKGQTIHIKLKR